MIENFVYLQLKTQFSQESIYFYRTLAKAEIDFVVSAQNAYLPIEVKFRNKVPKTLPVAMKNFQTRYPVCYPIILTKAYLHLDPNRSLVFLPCYLLPFFRW